MPNGPPSPTWKSFIIILGPLSCGLFNSRRDGKNTTMMSAGVPRTINVPFNWNTSDTKSELKIKSRIVVSTLINKSDAVKEKKISSRKSIDITRLICSCIPRSYPSSLVTRFQGTMYYVSREFKTCEHLEAEWTVGYKLFLRRITFSVRLRQNSSSNRIFRRASWQGCFFLFLPFQKCRWPFLFG